MDIFPQYVATDNIYILCFKFVTINRKGKVSFSREMLSLKPRGHSKSFLPK